MRVASPVSTAGPPVATEGAPDREGPLLHARRRVPRGLAVSPARQIGLECRLGCLAERGYPRPPPLCQRVATFGDPEVALNRTFTGVGERDWRVGAEADVLVATADRDSLTPRLGSRRRHVQVQRVAVAAATGNQGSSNPSSGFLPLHTHFHSHAKGEVLREVGRPFKTDFYYILNNKLG